MTLKDKKHVTKGFRALKMLGLYLYFLIIGHIYCNMLSMLNKLPLKKELQKIVENNVFWIKSKNTTTTKQKSNIKPLAGAGK